MREVRKNDRREPDEMEEARDCSHDRIYEGPNGFWYCADCPAWSEDKDAYDGRNVKEPNHRWSR